MNQYVIAIAAVLLFAFIWMNYKNKKKKCTSCGGNGGSMSHPMAIGTSSPSNTEFAVEELDRSSYLNKRENDYRNWMMSNVQGNIAENVSNDDRYSREMRGSYIPAETLDRDTRPQMRPEFYASGLAQDRETYPVTYDKGKRAAEYDANVDPFSDVTVEQPRDVGALDDAFSPTYLNNNKGQSKDLRPALEPAINPKFMKTKDDEDLDCLRGGKIPQGRGPLMVFHPMRQTIM